MPALTPVPLRDVRIDPAGTPLLFRKLRVKPVTNCWYACEMTTAGGPGPLAFCLVTARAAERTGIPAAVALARELDLAADDVGVIAPLVGLHRDYVAGLTHGWDDALVGGRFPDAEGLGPRTGAFDPAAVAALAAADLWLDLAGSGIDPALWAAGYCDGQYARLAAFADPCPGGPDPVLWDADLEDDDDCDDDDCDDDDCDDDDDEDLEDDPDDDLAWENDDDDD